MTATLADAPPALRFSVGGVEALRGAAVPTLQLSVRADAGGAAVRGLALNADVRIAAQRRRYGADESARLAELFGTPEQWARSIGSLPWVRTAVNVPAFENEADFDVLLPCSYDFEVAATKYLTALGDGVIPIDVVLTGSVFYAAADGRLQMTKLPWDSELTARVPLPAWREAVDSAFPDSGWLRLDRALLQRLQAYRSRAAFTDWNATIDALLAVAQR